jgi:dethiobiotin synthetase
MTPAFSGFFITGTDTEIGKTALTAALTHLLGQSGRRAVAIKPIAAGLEQVDGRWVNDDVQRLRAASNIEVQDQEVGPLQLRHACAPHIAAVLENVAIDRQALLAEVRRTAAKAEVSVVEGVGGFCVPLVEGASPWDSADLAVDLALPVVLVVGMRLGCINHALLSAEAIRARGLKLVAWVANQVDPNMGHADANFATLSQRLQAPCWGRVPFLPQADPAHIAPYLNAPAVLQELVAHPAPSPRQNIVILISGSGSNMQAIAETAQTEQWAQRHGIQIAAVISNRADAAGLPIAKRLGLHTEVLPHTQFASRTDFDAALRQLIDRFAPDLVVLAGFMRVLTPEFVQHYAGRLINIHPSLLPAFPGLNTHQRAIEAGCKVAGATVHEVSVEVDQGHILAQTVVPVLPDDAAETLAQRVLAAEHRLYPTAVRQKLSQKLSQN